jgi:hypothetical protein
MSEWRHPDDLTQDDLLRYRAAAEAAWGDDTRHESKIGHPNPAAGQCYVTSRWLTTHLGGHVGVDKGHYVWISPDKSHAVDLTGDQFSYPPESLDGIGLKLDAEDEGWYPTPEQKTWRPGPIIYKRKNHPYFDRFRVKTFKTEAPRVQRFIEKADAALENL